MIEIEFSKHVLPNGLRVILCPDHTAPVASIYLLYAVGSADEAPGRTGLAHLFEHLMFEGSANVSRGEHDKIIQEAGGTMNGMTSTDWTVYYETVPAEYLELMLWLESDRMGRLTAALTQQNLDNQRMVVKNEKRQRIDNRPYGSSSTRLTALVYPPGHPYHHDVIGSMQDLDAATLDDVVQFYETWYGPDNAILSIAGDIDPDEVIDMVDRHFGRLARRAFVPHRRDRVPLDILQDEARETVEDRVPLPAVWTAYRMPPAPATEIDAASLGCDVLSSGRKARLRLRLVKGEQLAQSASAGLDTRPFGASIAISSGRAKPGVTIEQLESTILEEVERMAADGPTDVELERVRAGLERSVLSSVSSASSRAGILARAEHSRGDASRWRSGFDSKMRLGPETIRDTIATYLDPRRRAVLTFLPEGTGDTTSPIRTATPAGAAHAQMSEPQGEEQ